MNDITPEERRILSRSIEYRNSMSLADALSRVKTEHDVAIARLREENIALHRRVADVESRMQAIMASVMSGRGPTARS